MFFMFAMAKTIHFVANPKKQACTKTRNWKQLKLNSNSQRDPHWSGVTRQKLCSKQQKSISLCLYMLSEKGYKFDQSLSSVLFGAVIELKMISMAFIISMKTTCLVWLLNHVRIHLRLFERFCEKTHQLGYSAIEQRTTQLWREFGTKIGSNLNSRQYFGFFAETMPSR